MPGKGSVKSSTIEAHKVMAKTAPFDTYISEYEQWFDDHRFVFLSELEALRNVLPDTGRGVEIVIGSGVFASPLWVLRRDVILQPGCG